MSIEESSKAVSGTFKAFKDMNGDDVKALPRSRADVSSNVSKTGFVSYKISLPIFNHTMTIDFRIKESAYYILRHLWKTETFGTKFSIMCPYRVVKCLGTDNKTGADYDYYYVEIMPCGIVDRKLHFTCFLGYDQIDEINQLGFGSDSSIVDRGRVLKDEIEISSDFLDDSKNDN